MILPIGPIHPALKEPIRLKLKTQGEKVLHAEIDYGYVHRGIERIMQGKTWQKGIYLSERVCGICSYIHTQTFAETFEKIAGERVPPRAQYLRVLTNELDRIQSHLIANSTYFKALEHETLFMNMLALREPVMDAIELLTGNRVNMGWNVVGGVRMDVKQSHLDSIMKIMTGLESDYDRYVEMFEHGPLLGLRSKDVGKMSKEDAIKGRAVGPIGRASGLKHDCREDHPTYQDNIDFKVIWRKEGDNFARTMNRFDEVTESIKIIKQVIENLPEGDIRKKIDLKPGYADWRNEAPRGEVSYFMETNGNLIKNVSIRTPSIMNIDACAKYMLDDVATVADAVATYTSCDPCIACAERVVIMDESGTTKNYHGVHNIKLAPQLKASEISAEISTTNQAPEINHKAINNTDPDHKIKNHKKSPKIKR
ncbi:hydrogenase large subunit [Methanobacterium paludis]|uniref:NADH dehydrogenase (Quinone) n=1 Tax=Methanobacterium paludis (strain DSM 25820 / JCM 18151 / SWAN1) TaxID=868131 RepID=F6D2P4_METPW|nr:nickel-dependent hydrogenase large subunit [Methanobacterium paludis]AEG17978.1 NADH dehydrogenase (quinone) [Methanobacterium paludis]